MNLITAADGSAAGLVNLLARDFNCFRDEHRFQGRREPVRLLKRAQIFVADLWACFEGQEYGAFRDIDKITMFADYRVPQMLQTLGCLGFSPPLDAALRAKRDLPLGGNWEMQLRGGHTTLPWLGSTDTNMIPGCSIWCVELIRREIKRKHPDAQVNAILIDFFLYDTIKKLESQGQEIIPHHRTRSIWY